MAFDEEMAERVRREFRSRDVAWEEKRMMGGLCFMVDEKMCVGVSEDRLMVRLDPADYDQLLERTGAEPMDFTGRPMKGFLWVFEEGLHGAQGLGFWLDEALRFNPKAQAAKKKKKR